MARYKYREPVIVEAHEVTDDTYDGYTEVCAYSLESLVFVDERLVEEKYKSNSAVTPHCGCEYADDGYCMKPPSVPCEHMRKIGYIVRPNYRWLYPVIGDYMIIREGKEPQFMTAEEFHKTFEPA